MLERRRINVYRLQETRWKGGCARFVKGMSVLNNFHVARMFGSSLWSQSVGITAICRQFEFLSTTAKICNTVVGKGKIPKDCELSKLLPIYKLKGEQLTVRPNEK